MPRADAGAQLFVKKSHYCSCSAILQALMLGFGAVHAPLQHKELIPTNFCVLEQQLLMGLVKSWEGTTVFKWQKT